MTKYYLNFWKLVIGNLTFPLATPRVAMRAGLSSFDRLYFKNRQADHCSNVIKNSAKDISANFISKVKESFARAFAPSFASALA
jgi:hypothetical protein